MWTRFYRRYGDLSQPKNFERCLEAMLTFKDIVILNPNAERIQREFWAGPPTYARLFGLFHEHFAERVGKPRWGDQLGSVEQYADPIFAAYPSAKMIHMLRDPRTRYKASLSQSTQHRGKAGWETAQWRFTARLANRNRNHYPGSYKVIIYENLLSNPEETIRDICSFLGEDFYPEMLSMDGALRFGQDVEKNKDDEPESRSNETFKHGAASISRPEMAFIQSAVRREMSAFGYLAEQVRFSLKDWIVFLSIAWPINTASMVAWNTSHAL